MSYPGDTFTGMEPTRNYHPDDQRSDEDGLIGLLSEAGIGAIVIYRGNGRACPQCVLVEMKPAA